LDAQHGVKRALSPALARIILLPHCLALALLAIHGPKGHCFEWQERQARNKAALDAVAVSLAMLSYVWTMMSIEAFRSQKHTNVIRVIEVNSEITRSV
jgi:hypothetical protein